MSTQKVLAIQVQVNAQQAQAGLNLATASTRTFAAGMQRVGQQATAAGASVMRVLTSWQSALVALVTAASGLQLGSALVREAKSLDEFSEKLRQLNLNAQELSTLEFVADRINVPFDTLAESVSRANIALGKLRNEGRAAILGVSLSDARGGQRGVLDVLQELGPAMERLGLNRLAQQTMIGDIFGRQALNVDRLMGAGVLKKYREEMDRLGGPTLQRNIDAGVKVADALDDVAFAWKRVKQEGVVALAELTPAVEWLAQRLGSLPSSVQGFAAALGAAAGSGPNAAEAQRNVMAFGRTIVDGMRDSAMALASAVGTTAGAAFETAVAGLGPTLRDVAYDALAPLLRKLPGVGDDKFPLSLSEQISQTRAKLLQAEAAARRNDSMGWSTESRAYVQQGGILRRTAVGMELSEQAEVAGKAGLLRRELQDLELQASRQRQERLDAFFKTLGSGATVSAQAWKEAAAVIDASWKRIETAANGLGERYGDTIFGPPSSLARPSGNAIFGGIMQSQQMLAMMGAMNGVGFLMGGAPSGTQGGEPDLRGVAFIRERRQVLAELQARESIAFGGDTNAARTRTQMAFAQQRNELFEKYGEAARQVLPRLERVQAIEERRMSLDAKVAATLRDLNKAQEEYNLSVAQRAQRVTAGLLTQDEARRADDVSASVLLSSQQAAADELRRLQQEYPEFARLVDDTTRDVRISMEQLAMSLQRISRGDWRAGFRAGLEDIRLQAEDVFTFTRDLTVGVANTMASGFSTAFLNIVNGTENVKDAFRNLASSVLTYIAQMTTQMLVFRAIAGIAGSFAGGTGGASGAGLSGAGNATASGMSIPNASSGLSLNSLLGPAGRFASGAAFHRGEVVPFASGGVVTAATLFPMSRGRTGLMGEAGPEAIMPLKRGRDGRLGVAGGKSITIAPVINVTVSGGASTQQSQRVGREVATAIVDAIQRDPDLRMIVRQM